MQKRGARGYAPPEKNLQVIRGGSRGMPPEHFEKGDSKFSILEPFFVIKLKRYTWESGVCPRFFKKKCAFWSHFVP